MVIGSKARMGLLSPRFVFVAYPRFVYGYRVQGSYVVMYPRFVCSYRVPSSYIVIESTPRIWLSGPWFIFVTYPGFVYGYRVEFSNLSHIQGSYRVNESKARM